MKFSEFRQSPPRPEPNVFIFVCEDDFLVQESQSVWQRIFTGSWSFEKCAAKEFEEIPAVRLMEDALSPSLYASDRAFLVTGAERLTKTRVEEVAMLQQVRNSSAKIVLVMAARKSADVLAKLFPVFEIDPLKPADVARWIIDRYKLDPKVARHVADNVGTDLYQLHNEMEKLTTYAGTARPIELRDVDLLTTASEQFSSFALDDAILERDCRKAAQVIGSLLDDGMEPLIVLSRIARLWRQLFVGKSLVGKRSAKDVAAAALVPAWKAAAFVASCKKFDWRQIAGGFRVLVLADRAFKTSAPDPEAYFDVMVWKMIG